MEVNNTAQEIVNEAYSEDLLKTGVYKLAALRTIERTASIMETLEERTKGLKPSDPVEITFGEVNSLIALHVANIHLALTSEAFRNSQFAKCEIQACKSYIKGEVQGVLKEIQEKQGKGK